MNMMRDRTARAVKRAATRIIIMPTGILLFRPVKAEIHPLGIRKSLTHNNNVTTNQSPYHLNPLRELLV